MTPAGIILCGGRSSRMGRPKAWLPFGEETLLARVTRILQTVARPVVVVAAGGQQVPALPAEVIIVRDEEEGRGPLQGLAAGLAALAGRAELAYLTGCDAPFLQPALVRRLGELIGDRQIAIPRVDERYHPLAALYRLEVLPVVRRLLSAGRRRVIDLLDEVPVRIVTPDELAGVDPTWQSLRNINTPAEYEAALRDAGVAGDESG